MVFVDAVCIDNKVFKLHYKFTGILLAILSIYVFGYQFFGNPIDCIVDEIPLNVMDRYCLMKTTFTIPRNLSGTVGKNIAHPGGESDDVEYHNYYQWVWCVLLFQAILFYVPRYIWKAWEGGRMKMLVLNLNHPLVSEESKADRKNLLVDYFASNIHTNNLYAVKFFICEVMNFVNVLLQLYFMHCFLDVEFSTYGSDVHKFTEMEQEDRIDPMSMVFPELIKCIFNKYGHSGSIQKLDVLCVIPLNIINKMIYLFLCVWFILLTLITGVSLIYRTTIVLCSQVRLYLLKVRSRLTPQEQIKTIARKCRFGDWFVLYLLGKNIDILIFKEFLCDLANKLEGKETL